MKEIDDELYKELDILGLIPNKVRGYNVGDSNYSKKLIQPWTIWKAYPELTAWDYDVIKRVLREKICDGRKKDYEKIIHICKERIRQLETEAKYDNKGVSCNNDCKLIKCVKDYYEDDGDKLSVVFKKDLFYPYKQEGCLTTNDGALRICTDDFLNEHFIF